MCEEAGYYAVKQWLRKRPWHLRCYANIVAIRPRKRNNAMVMVVVVVVVVVMVVVMVLVVRVRVSGHHARGARGGTRGTQRVSPTDEYPA